MSNDFNKRCAEALGCQRSLRKEYVIKLMFCTYTCRPEDMHFHDSYDWAMLLAKKALKDDVSAEKFDWSLPKTRLHGPDDCSYRTQWLASPQQISQAALEVLEAK